MLFPPSYVPGFTPYAGARVRCIPSGLARIAATHRRMRAPLDLDRERRRSARLGSLGSARLGSVRFGSVRFGSVRFGSVRFGYNSRPKRSLDVKSFFESSITFFPRCRSGRVTARAAAHITKNQTAGVDGCKRCHGSLLRHASRPIVTSRPLREARDRQLRQTVPGSRKTGRVLHALPRHPVATRSGEFGRKKAESGREPGRPEDATAWRFTRTQ